MSPEPPKKLRLAVLLSGSGRTLGNLLAAIAAGTLPAEIAAVVSSRGDVRGVEIARQAGLETHVIPLADKVRVAWSEEIFALCRLCRCDLVVMAGFLQLIDIPADYAGRVINIHPSLLPAFGGRGFHGLHVHRAVLDRGCTISGCTVHVVDSEYDHGPILLQKMVPVLVDDTPDTLAARVFAAECHALPEAIGLHARGLLPHLKPPLSVQ